MKKLALWLCLIGVACAPPGEKVKAIVGATLLNPGAAPVEYSMIIITGDRITRAGTMVDAPVPAGSEKIAAYGKWVVAEEGAIEEGAPANLRIYAVDPRTNPGALPERRLKAGEWTE
jgi:imidazolonepropionase-like amidohydrolase